MWKIVTVLVLTALMMFAARIAHDAPLSVRHDSGAVAAETGAQAAATPPLMYAGVRG